MRFDYPSAKPHTTVLLYMPLKGTQMHKKPLTAAAILTVAVGVALDVDAPTPAPAASSITAEVGPAEEPQRDKHAHHHHDDIPEFKGSPITGHGALVASA